MQIDLCHGMEETLHNMENKIKVGEKGFITKARNEEEEKLYILLHPTTL